MKHKSILWAIIEEDENKLREPRINNISYKTCILINLYWKPKSKYSAMCVYVMFFSLFYVGFTVLIYDHTSISFDKAERPVQVPVT